jgi:hypothetical protein
MASMRAFRHLLSLLAESWRFAWREKAFWILPFVLAILLLALIVVSGQAATPFIYALF